MENAFRAHHSPLAILFFVCGLGYGSAWYWCEFTGRTLTPEFINFGIAYTAFMVALEYVFRGVIWYIARKTETIADTEAKERERSKLEWILTSLTLAIVGSIGWLVLKLMR